MEKNTGLKRIFMAGIYSLQGFKHAFKAGISFGKDDLVIPESKTQLIEDTKSLIAVSMAETISASAPVPRL